ncbi:MAG: DUF1963 domain-containing protein [Desulfomonile tiedjei]|jgi:uncharacterized protein YwqG|uniref:DUF1963 domain-containing protein n=1 Tax=Desulfomonile tiedjei TaxID=2358 RepID=A0A9D6Z3T7_9BACT|nr:DUF1963 domain-containing protein [Desulfomonile tiedjei]
MKIEAMRKCLESIQFPQFADLIDSLADRCLRFDTTPMDEREIPLGTSKLGGNPDLPDSLEWPSFNDRRLDFLLQLDLSELSGHPHCGDLPESGLLYFFYDDHEQKWGFDPGDKGTWQVIFQPFPGGNLARRSRHDGTLGNPSFRPCQLSFYEALAPGWEDIPMIHEMMNAYEADVYYSHIFELEKYEGHQILGHPAGIQSDEQGMQQKCQFVSNGIYMGGSGGPPFDEAKAKELEPEATQWTLLLQLDTDKNAGMKWGDRGRLYFWIRKEDLQRRDFDRVWMILECY